MSLTRVTEGMVGRLSVAASQDGLIKLARLQERLTTGRVLNRPSDSPVDTTTSLRLRCSAQLSNVPALKSHLYFLLCASLPLEVDSDVQMEPNIGLMFNMSSVSTYSNCTHGSSSRPNRRSTLMLCHAWLPIYLTQPPC